MKTIISPTIFGPRPLFNHTVFKLSTLSALILLASQPVWAAEQANTETQDQTRKEQAEDVKALDTVVVTGTRSNTQRSVIKSLSPVDVISGTQLQATGKTGLLEAIAQYVPSFNLPDLSGGDKEAIIRSPTLRGLSAGQVLILVNGKRRHNSSVLAITGLNSGSAPTDLDFIPASSIERVEILRDGAAAQYGTDAIAGVINIILKSKTGGSATTTLGKGFDGQRDTYQQSLNKGFGWDSGQLNLSLEARYQNNTNQANPHTYPSLYPSVNGQPDPREATAPKVVYKGYGLPEIKAISAGYNFDQDINDHTRFYSFSTFGYREGSLPMNFRLPNGRNTITEGPHGYPDGYAPLWILEETDWQTAAGIKGEVGDWKWDLSSTFGVNDAESRTENNQNASLGPATPNKFDAGGWKAQQWVNNLDLSRQLDLGLFKPSTLSFGVEQRYDSYETIAGEWASYADGGYVFPAGHPLVGQHPDAGSQVTAGITPDQAKKIDRQTYAGYAELDLQPTEKWQVDVAGRAEKYTRGVGSTFSGKLSSRYDFSPSFGVRGTVSNGFRAPQLANEIFTTRSTSYAINAQNVYQSYTYGVLPVDSAAAKALGAEALKPEKSENYSLGFTWTPLPKLNLSVDAFQINIKDRIALGSILRGDAISAILKNNGVVGADGGQYFTNAVDTKTKGVDVVLDYKQDLNFGSTDFGLINWVAAYNYGKTDITSVKGNPGVLSSLGTGYELINRQARNVLTDAIPASKLILSGEWKVSDWSLLLRLTRYDKYRFVYDPANPSRDGYFGAKWITDLEGAYQINDQLSVALGAKNLFDVYPDEHGFQSPSGFGRYGLYSPFGFNGGYYYGRLNYKF